MDLRAASVDRREAMPSPYLWDTVRELEGKAATPAGTVKGALTRLIVAEEADRAAMAVQFGIGGDGYGAGSLALASGQSN